MRTDYKRAPVADIYNQIISDLRFAEPLLPTKPANGGKASRDAAAHLLAKVYLTRASAETDIRGMKPTDLDSCLYYAESVLPENGGTHKLMSNYADLWDMKNQGNSEVILCSAILQIIHCIMMTETGFIFIGMRPCMSYNRV